MLGAVVARDRDAYAYLAESMAGFVTREQYEKILREEGFDAVHASDLTMGVAAIVTATAGAAATSTKSKSHASGANGAHGTHRDRDANGAATP